MKPKRHEINLPKPQESDASDFKNVRLSETSEYKFILKGPAVLEFGDYLKGIGGHNISLGHWAQYGLNGPIILIREITVQEIGDTEELQAA